MRTLLLLIAALGLLACPSDPPPPPPRPLPKPAPAPPPPKPEPKPEPEPEPEPEPDPPGTLYNWLDAASGIHVTQTPPPKGATLVSKELPRVALVPLTAPPNTDTDVPPATSAPASAVDPRIAASQQTEQDLVDEINRLRSNLSGYAATIARKPGGEVAARALRAGRRSLSSLRRDPLADEAARTGKAPPNVKSPHTVVVGVDSAAQMVENMVMRPAERVIITDPDARIIGVMCRPDCKVYIAAGAAR